jgi:AraC-like DNA-binding protein
MTPASREALEPPAIFLHASGVARRAHFRAPIASGARFSESGGMATALQVASRMCSSECAYDNPQNMSITSTQVDRATIQFHEPAGPLKLHVGCFWVVTAECGGSIHLVPDGSTAIATRFRHGEPAEWELRGPLVRPETRRYASGAIVIGIRLRPGVAFLLSGIDADAMVGRHLRLGELAAFRELVATQPSPRTPAECIDALQRFLIGRLRDAKVHRAVAAAIREIERARGVLQVAELAARCEVSPRHLTRLMRSWVGYGPKRFASIVRFQETLHRLEDAPDRSAATLATETGFFDQAHLTIDVTRFAGATARDLAASSVADFSKTRCDDPA